MKYKLLTLLMMVISLSAYTQVMQQLPTNTVVRRWAADSGMRVPIVPSLPVAPNLLNLGNTERDRGALTYCDCDSSLYYWKPHQWVKIGSATGGSADLSSVVKYADTAAMLAPYLLLQDIVGKLNISDTAAMLTPYIRDIYKSNDSVYVIDGNGSRFAYIDSSSGGGTETDPIYSASPAYGIASGDISNWNTAYGWGNHAGLYPSLSGSYTNPTWISSLDWNKITNAPAFVPESRKISINGVEYDLSADRSWTISGGGGTIKPAPLDGFNTKHLRGYQLSGDSLYLQSADENFPGLVTTGAQTFAGEKTFNSRILFHNPFGVVGSHTEIMQMGKNGSDEPIKIITVRNTPGWPERMVQIVPANGRIDFHAGAYTTSSNLGNLLSLSPTSVQFGAPISGAMSTLTVPTTGSPQPVIVAGQNSTGLFGLGVDKFNGVAYALRLFAPANGRIEFKLNGNDGGSGSPSHGKWTANGLHIAGSTPTASNKLTPVSAALQVATTTQGSIPYPVLTTVQWNAVSSKVAGLGAYDSDKKQIVQYDGAVTFTYGRQYSGAGAPTTAPLAIGDEYTDTTNKKFYKSAGTASAADWIILN